MCIHIYREREKLNMHCKNYSLYVHSTYCIILYDIVCSSLLHAKCNPASQVHCPLRRPKVSALSPGAPVHQHLFWPAIGAIDVAQLTFQHTMHMPSSEGHKRHRSHSPGKLQAAVMVMAFTLMQVENLRLFFKSSISEYRPEIDRKGLDAVVS